MAEEEMKKQEEKVEEVKKDMPEKECCRCKEKGNKGDEGYFSEVHNRHMRQTIEVLQRLDVNLANQVIAVLQKADEHFLVDFHKALDEKVASNTHGKVLGSTTVGERGQVSIPAKARELVDIKAGDKMVVFGNKRKGTIIMVKADVFNKFADFFMNSSKKLESVAQKIFSTFDVTEEEGEKEKPEGE